MAKLEIKQGYYERLILKFNTPQEASEMVEKIKPHVDRTTYFTITDDIEFTEDEEGDEE